MRPKSYKKTKISLSILLVMLIASFLYDFIGPDDYRTMIHKLYDENGKLLKAPPYPPSSDYLLGTDRDGRDNLMLIIDGIKYTFAALVAVSFLRVAIGTLMGILIENWLPALKPFIKAFFLPFQYVPVLLIGVFLMNGYLFGYNEVPVIVKIEYQLIVLFVLGFPTVFFFTTDFIKEIKTKSFVTSSYLLGGSKWHIMVKQILPHLKPQLALLFVQQVLQTLQIMMGLAMFSLFLGGPHKETIYNTHYKKSISNELAGLTGQNFWWLKYASYIAISSLLVLLIIFLLIIIIKNELVTNMEGKNEMVFKSSSKMKKRKSELTTIKGVSS
ncbi:ABC transporter permease subunit [Bacillus sp. JJ1609]|uniref:ABC transporter permease subunit n=1 Tax=Bacillus sp. JJ1609 TaxID=3122977 RepID=UPI002FFF07E5